MTNAYGEDPGEATAKFDEKLLLAIKENVQDNVFILIKAIELSHCLRGLMP